MRLGLLTRFATLTFLCVVALAGAMGFALSFLLTRAVSEWEWENTAALIRREVEIGELDAFFSEPPGPEARERWSERITRLLAFSRRQPFHARLVHLNAIVHDIEPMLARLIGEDVRLQTALQARPAWVRADSS